MINLKGSSHVNDAALPVKRPCLGLGLGLSLSLGLALVLASWPSHATLTVTKAANLGFGSLVAGSSTGSVSISPSGVRSATGMAALFNALNPGAGSSIAQAAQFSISGGTPSATCTITLPSSVLLSGPGTGMNITSIISSPSASITLNGSGAGTVYVGGTLAIGSQQQPGNYANGVDLTIDITC